MSGNSWREMVFGWRPSFRSILGSLNRTGYFLNDVIDSRLSTRETPSPILKAARCLPTLSAAAAVGLEILRHEVNLDDAPGVVTRVNLPSALARIQHPPSQVPDPSPPRDAGDDDLHPSTSSTSQEEKDEDADEDDVKHLLASGHNLMDFNEGILALVEEECEHNDDMMNQVEKPVPRPATDNLVVSKSFGHKEPTWLDMFGAFQPLVSTTSLPNRHYWSKGVVERHVPFSTCKEVSSELKIPVPDSHCWDWYRRSQVDIFDERVLGDGTFAQVFQATMSINAENRENIIVRSVALKVFINENLDLDDVICEADASAYMASLGAGPEILGLLKEDNNENKPLPSLVMVYIEGSMDLVSLFTQENKPARHVVVDVLIQAARLLTAIHSHGFLHNDIKCFNLIVTPNPQRHGAGHNGVPLPAGKTGQLTPHSKYRVYLIDFGQTTYKEGAYYNIPQSEHKKLGPYPYLAPEVLDGECTSIASEVYSFGILLKTVCTILMDTDLQNDIAPIIRQCLLKTPLARPKMEEVECWLAGLLPPERQRCQLQIEAQHSKVEVERTETIADVAFSGVSVNHSDSNTSYPSADSLQNSHVSRIEWSLPTGGFLHMKGVRQPDIITDNEMLGLNTRSSGSLDITPVVAHNSSSYSNIQIDDRELNEEERTVVDMPGGINVVPDFPETLEFDNYMYGLEGEEVEEVGMFRKLMCVMQ